MQHISFESGRALETYPKILVVLDGPVRSQHRHERCHASARRDEAAAMGAALREASQEAEAALQLVGEVVDLGLRE